MGAHNAKPVKTDIPHVAARVVRTRTHTFIVFCKHMIVEGMAGFLAIIVFEAYRAQWLGLLGHGENGQIHAITLISTYL